MLRTSTPSTPPHLPPRGTGALSTLRQGGLVLLPTANLWQLVTDARQPTAVKRLTGACRGGSPNCPELVFADRDTLLSWFPQLHPKLDTLLSYHGRTVTMFTPATNMVPSVMVNDRDEVAVRLAMDSFCYRLCEDLEAPLAAVLAMPPDGKDLPTRFGKVRSDLLRMADYTVQRRQREELDSAPAVRVRMDGDQLEFL